MSTQIVEGFRCGYCNRTLDPRYHFCVNCATPYREPEKRVYQPIPPPKPSLDRVLTEKASSAWKFFCILCIGLIVGGMIAQILGEEMMGFSMLLQEVFLLTVTLGYMIYHWKDVAYLFKGMRFNLIFILSFPTLAILLAVNMGYHNMVNRILGIEPQDSLETITNNFSFEMLVFSICVFPAVVEEIGFRGVVQERMAKAVGNKIGYIATSFLFVALHFSILSAPYLFLLSMFLCWVRTKTRTLYLPMVLHFLHNFVVLVVFYGVTP